MFDRYKERYEKGWATRGQLERLVILGMLTQEEFNIIVNEQ